MGTKINLGVFDCYENAKDDEPMFVLLARDELAPDIVREWARMYDRRKRDLGITQAQIDKHNEALRCADSMERWYRRENTESVRDEQ